ncbi:hypothetical protein HanPSC8_Chr05g0193291 [Helianthus annuus]|nr:hypothetical protein HanPSC8_Chr05g0193291 [Helianthus annuus]
MYRNVTQTCRAHNLVIRTPIWVIQVPMEPYFQDLNITLVVSAGNSRYCCRKDQTAAGNPSSKLFCSGQ